jgi:ribose 5-phosphate isomerase B
MKIAIGSDHGAFELKTFIYDFLSNHSAHEVLDLGAENAETSVDYPDYAQAVSSAVVNKQADMGILLCGTGIGISIAANKIRGIRAALCHDHYTAKMAREHNDANILVMGGRTTGKETALDILTTFLQTEFAGGRHQRRIDKIQQLENR